MYLYCFYFDVHLQKISYLLSQVKRRVVLAQQRAIYAANEEMLHMYWDIGELLEKSQMADGWGKKTLERLSIDLKNEYPKVKGFSVRNLQCMIQFYEEYNKELSLPKTLQDPIVQPPVAQLDKNTNNESTKSYFMHFQTCIA